MSQPNDPVATILQQWRRERPDLDVTPMGPVGRLRRSAVQVQKRLDTVFARHQLASWEFDLLATLRNAEPDYTLTPSQLLEQMLLTSGGLSKVMAQLEARGLIARLCRNDDRRIKPVRLTTDGQALIEQAMADAVAKAGAWLRTALSGEELTQLTGLLQRVAEADVPDENAPTACSGAQ